MAVYPACEIGNTPWRKLSITFLPGIRSNFDGSPQGLLVHHPIKEGWKFLRLIRCRQFSIPYLRYAVLRQCVKDFQAVFLVNGSIVV
jgi:hypothetical protein